MISILPTTVLTDPEVADRRVALLPVGSFEQHGPHLPLVTDTLIAVAISAGIAARHPVFQLPAVAFSCSHEHEAFPGVVSIGPETLARVVNDIAASLQRAGYPGLLVVNGHGGNYVLSNVVQQANARSTMRLGLYPTREDWREARMAAGMSTDSHEDMHAGELETSILLDAFPDLVREGWEQADHTHSDRRHLSVFGMAAYTKSGVIGRPSLGSAAKGRAALEHLAAGAGEILGILEGTSSDR